MSTAEKIFERAKTLPEPAQEEVLQLVAKLALRRSAETPLTPLTVPEAADVRGRLAAWEEDWNAAGMEAYDRP